MRKVRIAIIGEMGLGDDLIDGIKTRLGTRYGPTPILTIGKIGDKDVVFLPRHGDEYNIPPQKINNLANVLALYSLGVERIIATNVVGAINLEYKIGDIVIPKDFIDFTKSKQSTFYDDAPVTHIDVSELYCPELREIIFQVAKKQGQSIWTDALYICTEGPRYASPAEKRMFRIFGCDIIGMTGIPEAILAHELEMCYTAVCLVTNMATSVQKKVLAEDIIEKSKMFKDKINEIIQEAIINIPNKKICSCSNTLEGARI